MERLNRLGYNGELHEPHTPWQILGNGYRVYNPALRRFHSPDSMSPFGRGGINAYAYCSGDPINHADPDGHFLAPVAALAGLGVLAMGGVALSKGLSGDRKGAILFGAVAGGLVLAAGLAIGARAYAARQVAASPVKSRLPVKIAMGWGMRGEVIIRRRTAHGGVSMSIMGHGSPYEVRWGANSLDGWQLVQHVKAAGSGKAPVDYIELNVCFGAAGDRASVAQVVADDFGVRTFAYPEQTFRGWDAGAKLTTPRLAQVFLPQTGIRRAASAIRNTEMHRRARGLDTRRQLQLI